MVLSGRLRLILAVVLGNRSQPLHFQKRMVSKDSLSYIECMCSRNICIYQNESTLYKETNHICVAWKFSYIYSSCSGLHTEEGGKIPCFNYNTIWKVGLTKDTAPSKSNSFNLPLSHFFDGINSKKLGLSPYFSFPNHFSCQDRKRMPVALHLWDGNIQFCQHCWEDTSQIQKASRPQQILIGCNL